MTRFKILFISCIAVLGVMAVPAMAQASPELQTSAGAKVSVGAGIKGSASKGEFFFETALGNIECSTNTLEGNVLENSGSSIKGEITSGTFKGTVGPTGTECETTIEPSGIKYTSTITIENLSWCLSSTTLGSWSIKSFGTTSVCVGTPPPNKVKFKAVLKEGSTVRQTCFYERETITGTNNTGGSPLVLTLAASQTFTRGTGSTATCPATGTLKGKMTLTTTAGGGLKIV